MTEPTPPAEPPALALPLDKAAASLGVSENTFRRYVLPNVRTIKLGKVRVVPVIELERWLYLHAQLEDDA